LLVPSDDPVALAAALGEIGRDRDRARRMGTAGRERVLAEFSMEALTERYERLYDEVCERA
jgi:glycosyltransferase involved in cell wall biosynthesis